MYLLLAHDVAASVTKHEPTGRPWDLALLTASLFSSGILHLPFRSHPELTWQSSSQYGRTTEIRVNWKVVYHLVIADQILGKRFQELVTY